MYIVNVPEEFTRKEIEDILNVLPRNCTELPCRIFFCSSYREYLKYRSYSECGLVTDFKILFNKCIGLFDLNDSIFIFTKNVRKQVKKSNIVNVTYKLFLTYVLYHEISHVKQYWDNGKILYRNDIKELEDESNSFAKVQMNSHYNKINNILAIKGD